ncbi:MAG: hypothetical protein EXR86_12340 [Gammaproteobacteria bacterium]|nr:hypothetical protein [Gammaproteobacteria bacterium]
MNTRRSKFRAKPGRGLPTKSRLEEAFALQLKASGVLFHREFQFHPERRWRCDFRIPTALGCQEIIVEIEGGVYTGGRHTRGRGFEADIEKYNELAIRGYLLLRGTALHVRNGNLCAWVGKALETR